MIVLTGVTLLARLCPTAYSLGFSAYLADLHTCMLSHYPQPMDAPDALRHQLTMGIKQYWNLEAKGSRDIWKYMFFYSDEIFSSYRNTKKNASNIFPVILKRSTGTFSIFKCRLHSLASKFLKKLSVSSKFPIPIVVSLRCERQNRF